MLSRMVGRALSRCSIPHMRALEKESRLLTIATNALLEVLNLREGRVLAAGTQQIAEGISRATAVAALVEQGKRLLVVC